MDGVQHAGARSLESWETRDERKIGSDCANQNMLRTFIVPGMQLARLRSSIATEVERHHGGQRGNGCSGPIHPSTHVARIGAILSYEMHAHMRV